MCKSGRDQGRCNFPAPDLALSYMSSRQQIRTHRHMRCSKYITDTRPDPCRWGSLNVQMLYKHSMLKSENSKVIFEYYSRSGNIMILPRPSFLSPLLIPDCSKYFKLNLNIYVQK